MIKLLLSLRTAFRVQTREQGPRIGSIYIVLAVGTSGLLTYVFHSVSARFLGLVEFGTLATLWSATFLVAPALGLGITQTLARYIAEREARGEDWQPVVGTVRKLEFLLMVGFLLVALLLSPLLTERLFGGRVFLTVTFVVAIMCYLLSYFRLGLLSGHRQFSRVSGIFLVQSVSRVLIAAGFLIAGVGIAGPAIGIALAPLASVLLVRLAPVTPPQKAGAPFSIGGALNFTMPVLVSMACAQVLAHGGAILISGLGGTDAYAQAGLLVAALTLMRAPLNILGSAINNFIPHLSRIAALEDHQRFTLFVRKAVAFVGFVGITLVGGAWLFGNFAMKLLYGSEFSLSRELLAVLAVFIACHLLCVLLNQILFAKERAWFAAASWFLGISVAAGATLILQAELLSRVSYALAFGTVSTAVAQALFLRCLRTVRPTTS